MVDFPEYYEQMQSSLAPTAAPTQVAPAQPAVVTPNAAATTTTPSTPARPRPAPVQQNESPEMANALEQFQAAYRERLAAARPQGQLSVLDMLRKRMARDMEGEALQRVGEFGAGMLASGSPNFFTMLGAGARAAREGDVSRMDQLRRLAETERQQQELETRQAAQRAEEEYRRQSLTLREREIAQGNRPQYTVVGQDARGNAVVVDMRNPTQRQVLEGVTPAQVAAQNVRSDRTTLIRATAAGEQAVRDENRRRSDRAEQALSPSEAEQIFQNAFERVRRFGQLDAGAGAGAPTTSGGARPSQTLQYPRPQQ
jgi:hypothetical protein